MVNTNCIGISLTCCFREIFTLESNQLYTFIRNKPRKKTIQYILVAIRDVYHEVSTKYVYIEFLNLIRIKFLNATISNNTYGLVKFDLLKLTTCGLRKTRREILHVGGISSQ